MIKYFKLPKDAPAAKKILQLLEKGDRLRELFLKLSEKYGWEAYYCYTCYLSGIQFISFKKGIEPDKTLYKRWANRKGAYTPRERAKSKQSKEKLERLKADWDSLNQFKVERQELDAALGKRCLTFSNCGFNYSNKDILLISIEDVQNYDLPVECIEITGSEYESLSLTKEE